MKNMKSYILVSFLSIILSIGLANANDEFGSYVAKAVFFKWSPQQEAIKESTLDNEQTEDCDAIEEYDNRTDYYNDNEYD